MQKKYPHKLARRIPKKQAKVKKKDEKCVELKNKDNMECWYSADSWEKKTKQKTKQIIKNENQTLSFRCRRTAVVFDTKVIELSFPIK